MNPGKHGVRGDAANDLRPLPVGLEAPVGRQSLADDRSARLDSARDKAADVGRREIGQRFEADAARSAFWRKLGGANYQQLPDVASTLTARHRIVFGSIRDFGSVDLP